MGYWWGGKKKTKKEGLMESVLFFTFKDRFDAHMAKC